MYQIDIFLKKENIGLEVKRLKEFHLALLVNSVEVIRGKREFRI